MRTVAQKKLIGEEATVIHTEVIEILVARLHPDEVPGSRRTLETGSVQLPESADVAQVLSGVENFVDVEVFLWKLEIARWDASSSPESTIYSDNWILVWNHTRDFRQKMQATITSILNSNSLIGKIQDFGQDRYAVDTVTSMLKKNRNGDLWYRYLYRNQKVIRLRARNSAVCDFKNLTGYSAIWLTALNKPWNLLVVLFTFLSLWWAENGIDYVRSRLTSCCICHEEVINKMYWNIRLFLLEMLNGINKRHDEKRSK